MGEVRRFAISVVYEELDSLGWLMEDVSTWEDLHGESCAFCNADGFNLVELSEHLDCCAERKAL